MSEIDEREERQVDEYTSPWGSVWKEVDPAVEPGRADHYAIMERGAFGSALVMLGWDEFDAYEQHRKTEFYDGIWVKVVRKDDA